MHVAPPATWIVMVPAGVTVLLGPHNTSRSWTGTVGPSLPGFTVAPCVDSLVCYRLTKQPKSILKTIPKSKVRVYIYTITLELSYSSLG
jgi:hypothetical protein